MQFDKSTYEFLDIGTLIERVDNCDGLLVENHDFYLQIFYF